jgi:hypothetical protein
MKARSNGGEFSFKGFYAGEEIGRLSLTSKAGIAEWKRGEDYVLYIRVHHIVGGTLSGEVLRSRSLDELACRD